MKALFICQGSVNNSAFTVFFWQDLQVKKMLAAVRTIANKQTLCTLKMCIVVEWRLYWAFVNIRLLVWLTWVLSFKRPSTHGCHHDTMQVYLWTFNWLKGNKCLTHSTFSHKELAYQTRLIRNFITKTACLLVFNQSIKQDTVNMKCIKGGRCAHTCITAFSLGSPESLTSMLNILRW